MLLQTVENISQLFSNDENSREIFQLWLIIRPIIDKDDSVTSRRVISDIRNIFSRLSTNFTNIYHLLEMFNRI